jgi:hypothetical protein
LLLAWGAGTTILAGTALTACGGHKPNATPDAVIEAAHGGSAKRKACPADGSKAVNFSAYYLGSSFQGLPLQETLRQCTKPGPGRARVNYVSFIYGDCVARSDTGCAPPLEIRSDPACEYNLSRYRRGSYDLLELRGVPAATFGGDPHLEIFTGDATVAVSGRGRELVMDAAEAMMSIPGSVPAVPSGEDLPKPARGAMRGKFRC